MIVNKAPLKKKYFIVSLLLFSFISSFSLFADPFIEVCNNDECTYIEAEYEINGCSGSDVVLYAIDPTGNDPCLENATYQWYTYDFYNTGSGWEFGWITVVGATNNRYEVNNHGTFEYYCEVTCDGQTYNTSTVEVSYNSLPPSVISHPEDAEVCEGTEVFFEGLGSGSQLVYQWQTKSGTGLWEDMPGEVETALSYTPGINDDGRAFRLRIANACSFTVTASANLTINANPSPSLGTDAHICEGSSIEVGSDGSFSNYLWNTGSDASTINVSETGSYILTVTSAENCTGSDTIMVVVDPPLTGFSLGNDITACMGEEVLLDVPQSYDTYTWNDGSEGSSLTVTESGDYHVSVSSSSSVCTAADTIHVTIAEPFDQDHICMITTDPETGRNLVIWERTPDVGILSYNVYRQSNVLGEYDLLANLSADELSVFEDPDADPEVRQWVYKLTAIDTCGNESPLDNSPYHIPLFLQYVSSDNGVNLSWVPYEVQNGSMNFVSYVLFRGTDSTRLEQIGEISSDLKVYRDTDPDALKNRYFYRIAGVRADACVPLPEAKKAGSGPFIHSLSNLEDNKLSAPTGINASEKRRSVSIYPNPAGPVLNIRVDHPEEYNYIRIMDLSGKVVLEVSHLNQNITSIDTGILNKGMYIVELGGKTNYYNRIVVK